MSRMGLEEPIWEFGAEEALAAASSAEVS